MNPLDELVLQFLRATTGRFFLLDGLYIFLGKYLVYIFVALFLLYVLLDKSWRRRAYYLSISALGVIFSRGIITPIIRFLYDRPRPFVELGFDPMIGHESSQAFPSGHITFIIPIALALWLFHKKASVWFLVGSVFIGLARVAAGLHWPTDILGGILVGIFGFALAYILLKKTAPKIKEAPETKDN